MSWLGGRTPVFAVVMQLVGAIRPTVAAVFWFMSLLPIGARWPVTCLGAIVLLLGMLAADRDPPEARTYRLGAAMYLFPMTLTLLFGLTQYFVPQYPPESTVVAGAQTAAPPATVTAAAGPAAASTAATGTTVAAGSAATKKTVQADKADKDPEFPKTAAGRAAETADCDAKNDARVESERKLQTSGTYAEILKQRVDEFSKHAAGNAAGAVAYIGMFLIGLWFVRSGVMENTAKHLLLFRRLATVALPAGLLLCLLGVSITTARPPGVDAGIFQIMRGLGQIGNFLPAWVRSA